MNFLTNAFKNIVISPIHSMATNAMRCQPISSTPLLFKCSFNRMHRLNVLQEQGLLPKKKKKSPLGPNPFLKGVILKCLIKKPRKPNSANRKCVLVRLSNGKETYAYVPGIGHNLQEHHVVLCQSKKVKDVPGLKLRCVRGKYDLPHVIKQSRV